MRIVGICKLLHPSLDGRFIVRRGRMSYKEHENQGKVICGFNAIAIRIPESYVVDFGGLILKFMWRGKRPRIANTR